MRNKFLLPALISIVFLTSCSQALYKNKYDWVKVDRQPATTIARSETKPELPVSEAQAATSTAMDSPCQSDSCATESILLSNGDTETQFSEQAGTMLPESGFLTNEDRVEGSVLKVKENVKSGLSRLKFRKAPGDGNSGRSVWNVTRIILIIAAIGFLLWAIGGWQAVLITLAVGGGIIIGIMLVVYLIIEIIGEIFDAIFS